MALAGAMLALGAGLAAASAPPLTNISCPVEPQKAALGRFWTTHQGRRVHFCCQKCRAAFEREPRRYLAVLAPLAVDASPAFRRRAAELRDSYAVSWIALVALCGWTAAQRVRHRAEDRRGSSRRWAIAVVVLQSAVIVDLLRRPPRASSVPAPDLSAAQAAQGEASANYALLKQAFRQLAPSLPVLERTYYRGNDERDARLFNGGVYRTATLRVAVVAGEGAALRVGDGLRDRPLAVELTVDRSPGTAEGHFDDADVTRYRLVRARWQPRSAAWRGMDDPDPAGDTALVVLKPGWKWRARYALGPASRTGLDEGVLYLTHHTVPAASYVVHYRVATGGGRVSAGSSLFMAAVYGADFPQEQWLSEKPIPEIAGQNTEDRVLLGLEPGAAGLGHSSPPDAKP
jgi:YHS domain-containing protein